MVLTRVSWANRIWALPFLTALAPSERYYANQKRAHKKITDWARQLLLQVKRWVPLRQLIAVGDSSYAVIELLQSLQGQVSLISRLRLDAALYEPVPVRLLGQLGLGTFDWRLFLGRFGDNSNLTMIKRRIYDEAFKVMAVELSYAKGSIQDAAASAVRS